jgi:hypothetical protein
MQIELRRTLLLQPVGNRLEAVRYIGQLRLIVGSLVAVPNFYLYTVVTISRCLSEIF